MVKAGSPVSFSPASELRIGYGPAPILAFDKAGATIGLSVDSTPLTGNADMFGVMKLTQTIANGMARSEFALPPRRVLEMATIEGARSLGLADQIGSLAKGKRADLIMVDAGGVNMIPFTEPDYMLVDAASPANVDTVMVDGRILKRGGRLTAINARELGRNAGVANSAALKRAGWI